MTKTWRFYRDRPKSEMASGGREEDGAEDLRLEIEAELMRLSEEGLAAVAAELDIRQGRYLNRGKMVVLREIRNQLDRNEADPALDSFAGLRYLQIFVRRLLEEPLLCEGTPLGQPRQPAGEAPESSSESDAMSVSSGGSGSDARSIRRRINNATMPAGSATGTGVSGIGRGVGVSGRGVGGSGRGVGRGMGMLQFLPPIPRANLGRGQLLFHS